MTDEVITYAIYECLCCSYRDKVRGKRKDYKEINVCPKCNGAFVDSFYIAKYKNKCTGLTTGGVVPLLTIELQDETTVPKVIYKGKEIIFRRNVYFDWDQDTDVPGGLTYAIEHYERGEGKRPGAVNRIERRVGSHAAD